MKYLILALSLLLTSCQYIPDMAKDIESIATDTAIRVEVSRETFLKETDLEININVQNKDEPVVKAPKGKIIMLDEIKNLFNEGLQYTHTAGLLQQIANIVNIVHAQYMKDGDGKNAAIDLICKILQSHKDVAVPVAPAAPEAPNAAA